MKESTILAEVINTLGRLPHVRVFRNNSGVLQDERGNYVRYGVPPTGGGSDLIGWVQRDGVAVFLAIECKTLTGKVTLKQARFLAAVREAGGVAGIARSVEDALRLIGE